MGELLIANDTPAAFSVRLLVDRSNEQGIRVVCSGFLISGPVVVLSAGKPDA